MGWGWSKGPARPPEHGGSPPAPGGRRVGTPGRTRLILLFVAVDVIIIAGLVVFFLAR